MAYSKAPEFDRVFPVVEDIMSFQSNNLFEFIFNSIKKVSDYLELQTEFIVSSSINMNHNLHCGDRVLETCIKLCGTQYLNLALNFFL